MTIPPPNAAPPPVADGTPPPPSAPPSSAPAEPPAHAWTRCFAVLIAAVAIASHRPDALTAPQFWAEDGEMFAEVYNERLSGTLLRPIVGYLVVWARLAARASLAVPMAWSPMVFNAAALAVQVLPVWLLLSRRGEGLIPGLLPRLLLAAAYVGMPDTAEMHASLVYSQWFLALSAVLVLAGRTPDTLRGRAADCGLVAMSAFSGPFALLMLPLSAAAGLGERLLCGVRRPVRWELAVPLLAGAAVQGWCVTHQDRDRPRPVVERPPFDAPVRLIASQVVLAGTLGPSTYRDATAAGWDGPIFADRSIPDIAAVALASAAAESEADRPWWSRPASWLVSAAAAALVGWAAWRGTWGLRLLAAFAGASFAAAMASPLAPPTAPWWELLLLPRCGARYWFFPTLALLASAAAMTAPPFGRMSRAAGAAVLLMLAAGAARDWFHPALPDLNFRLWAAVIEPLPPGTVVDVPINPPGWKMRLIKR